mgnify:CR=1 FL=1
MKKDSIIQSNNKEYISIKDWDETERPRERLIRHGASALSDAELLAIVFGTGTHGISAVDLARNLINKYGNISKLAKCDYSEFKNSNGIGTVKAVSLAAVFEISRRIEIPPYSERTVFRYPSDIAEYYIPRLRDCRVEIFKAILLNSSNQIMREVDISEGLVNESLVHPREVFRIAITESAVSVLLIHNHPSGNTEPSTSDIKVTRQLVEAGKIIGIKVIDHLIIAGDKYSSLLALGLI